MADRPGTDTFSLLFVCTGNVCRSPTAELLARHLLVGRLGGRSAARFRIGSAGIRAVTGAPVHPASRAQLAPWGLDGVHSEHFVARQLDRNSIAGVHLVLGASPRHRSAVLEEFPELLGATFSLLEFARLVSNSTPSRLPIDPVRRAHAVVEQAWSARGAVPPGDDRIPDPIGGVEHDFQRATRLTFEALSTIMDRLAPSGCPDPSLG